MYYSAIGLLALLILLIENQDILRNLQGAFEKPVWDVYRKFLYSILVYYITDILWGFLESKKLSLLLFADTTVYFAAIALGVLFWAEFTIAYLEEKNAFGRILEYAGRVLAVSITLLAVINIFVPVLFIVDKECVYHALPVRYVMLVGQILLLLLISAYAITNLNQNQSKREKRYRTLALFGLIMALFLFGQLWFPYYPLYSVAYLLGTCLLRTFVMGDEKEEYRLGLMDAEKIKELKNTIVSLLDNMPAMTFTKDAESGVYLACNQAFADYAHKENPAGVIGLTDAQIFDAETAAHFVQDDQMALSMDEPFIFFEDVPDAAGSHRQLQTTKLKYYNFAGQLCILGMCQDMTDAVRIQHDSATSKEAYEKARGTGIIYTHIAQALARGYKEIYYVNLDSEEFVTYRNDDEKGMLFEARRGWHFFEECRLEIEHNVHPDDRTAMTQALNRKNLVKALNQNKTFFITYRLLTEDGSRYFTMMISRMEEDDRFIVLGVTDVDEQMKQRRAAVKAIEEQTAYARLNALSGNYLCVYVVDPETGRYREFSATENYEEYAQAKAGMDFFNMAREAARKFNHPDDLNRFLSVFTEENVMAEIKRRGIFSLSYRLIMRGKPLYVQMKAAIVEEKEGTRLIVGINDVDTQVRQEEEYIKHLSQARINANIDALTGVKNRHAYLEAEERLNQQIAEHRDLEFAIVLLDVNDLKKVNDTEGHNAGDQYIRNACKIICETFKHSPVFRVGGDEFAVISQGNDYSCIEELMGRMNDHNTKAIESGGIVIACGMSRFENDESVAPVFERADQLMYDNKSGLKAAKNV